MFKLTAMSNTEKQPAPEKWDADTARENNCSGGQLIGDAPHIGCICTPAPVAEEKHDEENRACDKNMLIGENIGCTCGDTVLHDYAEGEIPNPIGAEGDWREEFDDKWDNEVPIEHGGFVNTADAERYANSGYDKEAILAFISSLLAEAEKKAHEEGYIEGQKHAFGVDKRRVENDALTSFKADLNEKVKNIQKRIGNRDNFPAISPTFEKETLERITYNSALSDVLALINNPQS